MERGLVCVTKVKVHPESLRGQVDRYIVDRLVGQLSNDHVLIDTFWMTVNDPEIALLDDTKIAVCYSGIDWENTRCIEDRILAHRLINNKSSLQIHIGNTNNKYFFSYWAEFIRQNPNNYFNESYTQIPNIEKLFLSYNRRGHQHRTFLLSLIDEYGLADSGIISRPTGKRIGEIEEYLDPLDDKIDMYSLGDPMLWNKFLINVVTESTTYTDLFISEKTWKPIIGLRPFLILGDTELYTKLKELEFDTFDDLFGTWWKDHQWEDRARSIVDILKNFENDHTDLNKLYAKLLPRLQYNRENFILFMSKNHDKICNLEL